jgi:hypothetical protein
MYDERFNDPDTIRGKHREGRCSRPVCEERRPMWSEVVEFMRYDGVNHLPVHIANEGCRCKMPGCKKRSVIWCIKCKVYLCVKKGKSCFVEFHTYDE